MSESVMVFHLQDLVVQKVMKSQIDYHSCICSMLITVEPNRKINWCRRFCLL